jgi:hypothetical protein
MIRKFLLAILIVFIPFVLLSQTKHNKDSLVKALLSDQTTPDADPGVQLIQSGNYSGANKFFSNEISKDESDRNAYFKRGVANWALSDTLSACRDWSAVLALGDTEMFMILDGHCNGAMIISEDTIPSKQYHKMFARNKSDETSIQQGAKTVVETMPSFPGGEARLVDYISKNLKRPRGSRPGMVFVNFLIDPKGKVLFPYVTKGINKECDKEAVRLIRNMPAWNPGKHKGKAVYVRNNLPIRF